MRSIIRKLKSIGWRGHFHHDIRRQMIAFQLDQAGDGAILVCGDSRVEAALLPSEIKGKAVVNGGIGGATVSTVEAEMPRILGTRYPALLVLSVGVNDAKIKGRSPRTAAVFGDSLEQTIAKLKHRTELMLLTSIPPVEHGKPLGSNYYDNNIIHTFNEILETAATDHDLPFIDLAAPMRNSEGSLRAGASIDGVHLSRNGYNLWKSALIPGIERAIG